MMTREFGKLVILINEQIMNIRMVCVYHRHYPEARGRGRSLREASNQLIRLLTRNLDHVHGLRRQAVERAIADVRSFRLPGARALWPGEPRRIPFSLVK